MDHKNDNQINNPEEKEEACEMAEDHGGTDTEAPELLSPQELAQKLNEAQEKNEELLDKLQRTMAEFDNFRKRTAKEKTSMYDDGVGDTVTKLLPVIDNFERALSSATDQNDAMYKGVEMIYKQLGEFLVSVDVTPISCGGEKFDPNLHYAVSHEENSDFEENVIIEELQKGYRYKDRVLRPSMVKVAN